MGAGKRKAAVATVEGIDAAAESVLLDVVRQHPRFHFTTESVSEYVDSASIRRSMGFSKDDRRDLVSMLQGACRRLNARLKCFQIVIEPWGGNEHRVNASLTNSVEWADAIAEAWSFSATPNDFYLTDAGFALLEYVRSGDVEKGFVTEQSLSHRLGFHGRLDVIEPHFDEVILKAGVGLKFEKKGGRWGAEKPMYRLWTEPLPKVPPVVIGINPVFELTFGKLRATDVDIARKVTCATLIAHDQFDAEAIPLVAISSRCELLRVFPNLKLEKASNTLFSIFSSLTLGGLQVGCDLREEVDVWTVTVGPEKTWAIALAEIRNEMNQPPLAGRYGIGPEAAKLLHWIVTLPQSKRLLGRVTPVVEDAAPEWIGIKCPWSEENTSVYLRLLIDELNDRTPYRLELVPWMECGRRKSRIVVGRKKGQAEQALTLLRQMSAARGIPWDEEVAHRAIEALVGPEDHFYSSEAEPNLIDSSEVRDDFDEDESD